MLKGDRKEGCSEGQLWWRCGLRIHLSDTIEGRDAEVGKLGRSEGYFHHCPHLYSHHNRCHYRLMPEAGSLSAALAGASIGTVAHILLRICEVGIVCLVELLWSYQDRGSVG